MLSDTLAKIKILLQNNELLCEEEIEGVCRLLSLYRTDMWIYPRVFTRKIPLSIDKTYALFCLLVNNNIVKPYYELICFNCNHPTGKIFETLNGMPQTFECEHCHETMVSIENSIVVFKVIEE